MPSMVQTLIFSKSESPGDTNEGKGWTTALARDWLRGHAFEAPEADETDDSFRYRQFDPAMCARDSFVTLTEGFPAGVSAVSCTVAEEAGRRPPQLRRAYKAETAVRGRLFSATITTSDVDSYGDVIVPDGIDPGPLEKLRTVYWNHDYNRPVGKLVGKLRRRDGRIDADAELAARPETHEGEWFPDTVLSLIQQQVVNGVSVGLDILEAHQPTPAETKLYGLGCQRVIARSRLLEYSVAPAPVNLEAMVTAVKAGRLDRSRCMELLGVEAPPEPEQRRVVLVLDSGQHSRTEPDPLPTPSEKIRKHVMLALDRARGRI